MKNLLVVIAVVAVVWLGVNYEKTGQLTFFPKTVSMEELRVQDLEKSIADLQSQINQAGRSAGMTGMDTTADVSALMEKKADLEKQLVEARKKLAH